MNAILQRGPAGRGDRTGSATVARHSTTRLRRPIARGGLAATAALLDRLDPTTLEVCSVPGCVHAAVPIEARRAP